MTALHIAVAAAGVGWLLIGIVLYVTYRRGQGLGRALLSAAEDVARDWDCQLIEVSSARRTDRDAAHSFYAKSGFEDTRERSVRYWKTLSQS